MNLVIIKKSDLPPSAEGKKIIKLDDYKESKLEAFIGYDGTLKSFIEHLERVMKK